MNLDALDLMEISAFPMTYPPCGMLGCFVIGIIKGIAVGAMRVAQEKTQSIYHKWMFGE
jgi:hypothetical protein